MRANGPSKYSRRSKAQVGWNAQQVRANGPSYTFRVPQSLTFLLIHIVFSTKDRLPTIQPEVQRNLHAYLAVVARNLGCECFRVGGVADHVHLAVGLSRTITLADLVSEFKTSSPQWMKTQDVQDCVATRIRRVQSGAVGFGRAGAVHRHAGAASPEGGFSGRVAGHSGAVRRCARRAVPVGLKGRAVGPCSSRRAGYLSLRPRLRSGRALGAWCAFGFGQPFAFDVWWL